MNPTLRTYAELVRAPAAITVPGDVVAGALAAGRPGIRRTTGLAASSVALYWAGMALNDWADRAEDAVERPERPIPSGRLSPGAALATAVGLTGAGLGLAALAGGRRTLLRRTLPLATAVWAYDLGLKSTPLGPAAMAAARALDVLHGTGPGRAAPALPAAAAVAAHTFAVTRLSRHEVDGAPTSEPKLSLATTTAITGAGAAHLLAGAGAGSVSAVVADRPGGRPPTVARLFSAAAGGAHLGRPAAGAVAGLLAAAGRAGTPGPSTSAARRPVDALTTGAALATYAGTCARAQTAVVRDPSAPRVRAAVGAGIHALLPLQAALVARAGAPLLALPLVAALPLVGRLARKVSST
ncbi:UbiA family prenyltransferase (plasmid) [Streptomyces sp. NBC_01591]|uniref:SCO3242 family prenyltransferase n=1 Tax=Streptomyces sp. NBC_01591 TaxID=2975888 RepID=UPI002DDB97C5|nr:UbiA family prenyltransferase [Streptomyces sp. NBC_01591]WSD73961.1 UbiA family prenyltransferase [Streptomyces sp. NBC_01591]